MKKRIHIHTKGLIAEAKCCNLLCEKKYTILHHRFRTKYGEIDVVASKNDVLYMFEVKYRDESIDAAKAAVSKSVMRMYQTYLAVLYDMYPDLNPRFKYFVMSMNYFEFGDITEDYDL